ncbi:MAG: membrane protein insertion efficiency factor YidD [Chloroflexi bacterium]|nr:membrane protein insertion efficiency factor YidD [Chloroflexota bacterium]
MPPAEAAIKYLSLKAIRLYQALVSPFWPGQCRYHPSCSQYACVAIQRHGLARGVGMALWRLLRCGPWGGRGYDPVPEQ